MYNFTKSMLLCGLVLCLGCSHLGTKNSAITKTIASINTESKITLNEIQITDQRIYTNYNPDLPPRPVIVYIVGSTCNSMIQGDVKKSIITPGSFRTLVENYHEQYWIFTLEKEGIEKYSQDTPNKPCSDKFYERDRYENRVENNLKLLELIRTYNNVDAGKIILMGFSEGADVGAGIFAKSNTATHLGYFSGGGTTQFFDFLVLERLRISNSKKQEQSILEHLNKFKTLLDGKQQNIWFLGSPNARWQSYGAIEPYKVLLENNKPVFIAHGLKDNSVPVQVIDFLEVQFILNGRSNYSIKRYPHLSHGFSKEIAGKTTSKMLDVFKDFFSWIYFKN